MDWKGYNQQLTYSNGKLKCKEDLTYKQLENLIKKTLGSILQVLSIITQHKIDNLETY